MKLFQWENCRADIEAAMHHITLENYFEDVVVKATSSLDEKIQSLSEEDDAAAFFHASDLDLVKDEAMKAFALSVQSIFERQFRAFVLSCARELSPENASTCKLQKASWTELRRWFREIRGIGIEDFPCFQKLNELQLLGNACRHGGGGSAKKLYSSRPELWLEPPEDIPELNVVYSYSDRWRVDRLKLSLPHLMGFVDAAVEFWRDVGYIYNVSIKNKDPSLVERIRRETKLRSWVPLRG